MTPSTTLTVWVEAEAVRSYYSGNVWGAKVGRVLKRRPNQLRPDTHLIQVDIEVPHTAFEHRVKVELGA